MRLGAWKEKIKMNFIDLTGQVHILPNPYLDIYVVMAGLWTLPFFFIEFQDQKPEFH